MSAAEAGRQAMRGKGLVLGTLCLAALILNLDTTIVNVALPALVRQLGATTSGLQWVVDAYNLVFAATVLAAGSTADRLGRKQMLLAGLGVFGAASLAGALAATTGELIAARAVMGLGAAMVFPATLSLLTSVFTERRARAAAIGLWGASAGVGVALGPIAGGWLLERFWWGSIFLFMVPVAALVAVLAAWRVPPSRDPRTPPVDRRGLVLSAAGMSLIVYAVIQAPAWGWASPVTIGVLAAGLAALGALVAAERVTASPMIDVRLFRNLRFTTAAAAVAISFFALLGFIFLITQYFQLVHGYSPLSTGVRLLPVAASVGAASAIGTRLAVPLGNKVIVGGGMGLVCAALVWISTVSQTTSYGIIAAQMVVFGIGMGMTQSPATEAIMGAVPEEKGGIASAVNGCTRLFGGTLGVAVIGSVAASLYTSRLTALLPPGLPARAVAAARGSVGGAAAAASHLSQAGLPIQARALEHAAVLAFLHSLTGGCLVAAAVAAAGCLLVAFLLPARPGAVHPATGHPATGPAASPPPHAADGPDTQVPAGTPTPTSAVLAGSRQDQPALTDHDQIAAR
jgi:EmrB/QacA subfamily drug resistance transporter